MRSICHLLLLILAVLGLTQDSAHAGAVVPNPDKKIAIVLFDGVDIIDFSGPFEIFLTAGMDVVTVSPDGKSVTSGGGMKIAPTYSYADAPAVDAIVVPGGGIGPVVKDAATHAWLRTRQARGELLLGVCNGAFTLANAGLLDGLRATTTADNVDKLRQAHPRIQVVRDARVVDSGRVVTTGGLSAGIDGALHVVTRLKGRGKAQFVAEALEYNWQPEGSFLPGLRAFHLMHQTVADSDLGDAGRIETLVSTEGDERRWQYVWHVRSSLDSTALAARIDTSLAAERQQMGMQPPFTASPGHRWRFTDGDGHPWEETLQVTPVAGTPQLHEVRLGIVRLPAAAAAPGG
ncbi:DJ-1/PfpI family protein [[Empedobacter] haloabium]|uniref:DJ-1/PfpI family protein n=1 Tax=[Empedobacter] haloabium TaxID=592317 RepID=A0ABZ1URM1_9BURK